MRRQFQAGPDERERIERTLVGVLESEPDLEFAWLHGSFLVADKFRDIDIGVHLSVPVEVRSQRGLELSVRLDQEIGFPIDVRVLNDAPVTFLFHVFREGRLLLSRNDERLADLMERTVREYLDAAPLLRQATIEAYGASLSTPR